MTWSRRLLTLLLLALCFSLLTAAKCWILGDPGGDDDDGAPHRCTELNLAPLEELDGAIVSTGEPLHAIWKVLGEPDFSVDVAAGVLPPGLDAQISGDSLVVSGAIAESGRWTPRLQVTDSCADGAQLATIDLEFLALSPGNCPDILLEDYGPQLLALHTSVDVIFDLSGGFGHYRLSVASGSLPPGMFLVSEYHMLFGAPTETGTFAFRLRVEDDCPDGSSALEADISVEVAADYCPPFTPGGLYQTSGAVGAPFSTIYRAYGGAGLHSFEVVDPEHLPPGVAQSAPGFSQFGGTPTMSGDFAFTLRSTDSCPNGAQIIEELCTITVLPGDGTCAALAVHGIEPSSTVVGEDYLGTLITTGGVPPLSIFWTQASLPPGLFIRDDGLGLEGRPLFPGTYTLGCTVSDHCPYGSQSVYTTLSLTVLPESADCPPLLYDDAALPIGLLGLPYSYSLNVTGGKPPLTWSLIELTAPGLSFANGTLSGTPTQIGEFTLRCYVYDACTPDLQAISIEKPFVVGGLRPGAQAASTGLR